MGTILGLANALTAADIATKGKANTYLGVDVDEATDASYKLPLDELTDAMLTDTTNGLTASVGVQSFIFNFGSESLRIALGGWPTVRSSTNLYLAASSDNKAVVRSTDFTLLNIPLAWASSVVTADLYLYQDAANQLAQRNGLNAQSLRCYYTYTDASNYQRLGINTSATAVELAAESAGTGAANIDLTLTAKGTGRVRFGTHSAIAAESVTGYIEIKDSGGTVRKIAVVS